MKRCTETRFGPVAAALLVAAAVAGLAGCNRTGDQPVPAPKVSQAPGSEVPPVAAPDTTPKASEVFKAGAPPEQTSTNAQPTDASHQLTKQEESTAMPMPGQANDHSTLAKDPVKR
jgi:hypothetical protein